MFKVWWLSGSDMQKKIKDKNMTKLQEIRR